MPVMYISGWNEQDRRTEAVSGAIMLDKPVSLSALVNELRLLLRKGELPALKADEPPIIF
jgi:hypothetical protein